jgi:hypothetical protein
MNATRRDLSWEGSEISLKEKVGFTDLIIVVKRKQIFLYVLSDEERLKSFH